MCVARHAQITQNNKFTISWYYCDFLHIDKYENLLQIDAMTLMGMVKHSQNL